MSCAPFREALSARLDGEDPGLDPARLDRHLSGCPACRRWAGTAAEVTRRVRPAPAAEVPDVTAAVLAGLSATRPARRRWADPALRLALLAVGAGQLAVALPASTGGAAMAAPRHLVHETAAWNLGLAACFVVIAVAPRLAAGALPFLLPFTAVLAGVTVTDLGAGHVHAGRAGVHLLLVTGAALVAALALRGRSAPGGPAGRLLPRWARRPVRLRATAAGVAGPRARVADGPHRTRGQVAGGAAAA